MIVSYKKKEKKDFYYNTQKLLFLTSAMNLNLILSEICILNANEQMKTFWLYLCMVFMVYL